MQKTTDKNLTTRRSILKGSVLGFFGMALPTTGSTTALFNYTPRSNKPYPAYPSLDPELVNEVVGKSHFDLDRVKELVEKYPELARATWEWRFGDFESAIGAASHVGRRDIIQYLLSKGASPNIFSLATLGAYELVKGIIDLSPGIQTSLGPHGISLLSHAKAGLRMKDSMNSSEIDNCKKLIDYLEELGDADGPQYLVIDAETKKKYLGDYLYGDSKDEGFTISLNMRNMISLGTIGGFGGALYKIDDNKFIYNGAPSTKVSFEWENEQVKSLTVNMPESSITATKI